MTIIQNIRKFIKGIQIGSIDVGTNHPIRGKTIHINTTLTSMPGGGTIDEVEATNSITATTISPNTQTQNNNILGTIKNNKIGWTQPNFALTAPASTNISPGTIVSLGSQWEPITALSTNIHAFRGIALDEATTGQNLVCAVFGNVFHDQIANYELNVSWGKAYLGTDGTVTNTAPLISLDQQITSVKIGYNLANSNILALSQNPIFIWKSSNLSTGQTMFVQHRSEKRFLRQATAYFGQTDPLNPPYIQPIRQASIASAGGVGGDVTIQYNDATTTLTYHGSATTILMLRVEML